MTKRMLPVALLFVAAILSAAPAVADEFSPGESLTAPVAGGAAVHRDDDASQKLINDERKMPANRGASSGGGSHTERQA